MTDRELLGPALPPAACRGLRRPRPTASRGSLLPSACLGAVCSPPAALTAGDGTRDAARSAHFAASSSQGSNQCSVTVRPSIRTELACELVDVRASAVPEGSAIGRTSSERENLLHAAVAVRADDEDPAREDEDALRTRQGGLRRRGRELPLRPVVRPGHSRRSGAVVYPAGRRGRGSVRAGRRDRPCDKA